MAEIYTNVAGVTFCNEDGKSRQDILRGMTKNYKIRLKDESSAEFPEAIGVYNARNKRVGFLPEDVALHIRQCGIDYPETLNAKIEYIGADLGKPIGMSIIIEDDRLDYLGLLKNPVPFEYAAGMEPGERADYRKRRQEAIEKRVQARKAEADAAAADLARRIEAEKRAAEQEKRYWEEERQRKAQEQAEAKKKADRRAAIFLVVIAIVILVPLVCFAIMTVDVFNFLMK